jgi:hypothetical protein
MYANLFCSSFSEFTLFQNQTESPSVKSIQTVLNICNNLKISDDDKDNCNKGAVSVIVVVIGYVASNFFFS